MSPENPPPETDRRAVRGKARKWMIRIHLWTSSVGLLLLLFFAFTGFLLNHPDGFGLDETGTATREVALDPALRESPSRETVLAFLRKHSVQGTVEDYYGEGAEIHATFCRPGERTSVVIDRERGMAEIETEKGNLGAVLTEIHRGETGTTAVSLLLDVSAILLALISISGLISALLLPARRREVLVILGICALATLGVLVALIN